ncbi:DNA-binding protein, partial [Klebsiella pneumoniae]|nr:DNA-binding protein [Klebsiella pneumoniae]
VARKRMLRSRTINAIGLGLTSTVLVVVLITKFTRGAWIAILAMACIYALMRGIRRHYDQVREELALGPDPAAARALPSRVHALVLVSRLHKP